jgi:hypothetical protein
MVDMVPESLYKGRPRPGFEWMSRILSRIPAVGRMVGPTNRWVSRNFRESVKRWVSRI